MYKKLMENKKAVFFDLDGTIINSALHWQRAFNQVALAYGLEGLMSDAFFRGINVRDELERLIKEERTKRPWNDYVPKLIPTDQMEAKVKTLFLDIIKKNPPEIIEGFENFLYELKELKKMPVALVSNSDRFVVDGTLQAVGINKKVFDFTIAGSEVKNRKPNPEIYIAAAKSMKLNPANVLVFEDSVTGARASVEAGMDTVIIWNTKIPEAAYPKEIKLKLSDFTTLYRNLDTTYMEDLNKAAQQIQ